MLQLLDAISAPSSSFTTIRKCAMLQLVEGAMDVIASFTTIRKCAMLQPQMALQTTEEF